MACKSTADTILVIVDDMKLDRFAPCTGSLGLADSRNHWTKADDVQRAQQPFEQS